MAKPRVFLSFDYDNDKGFKNNFVAQTKRQELPFAINDISIQEDDPEWQQKARSSIEDCDVFIVLLGENVKGGVKTYQRGVDVQRLCQGNGPAIMSVVAVSSQ